MITFVSTNINELFVNLNLRFDPIKTLSEELIENSTGLKKIIGFRYAISKPDTSGLL